MRLSFNPKRNPERSSRSVVNPKPETQQSGFATNHVMFDGYGTKPYPILNGNRKLSEYRIRFNKPHTSRRTNVPWMEPTK